MVFMAEITLAFDAVNFLGLFALKTLLSYAAQLFHPFDRHGPVSSP